MDYQTIKANQFLSSSWSGGETTELYIHPIHSDFRNRNFDFRISTATVKIEESTFTSLNGVKRTLMVLDGEMTLYHENHHIKKLNRFDSDYFMGNWNTTSKGQCIDFNLMTKGQTNGTVESLLVLKNAQIELEFLDNVSFLGLYLYSGELKIENDILTTGDLLIAETPNGKLEILGLEECVLIITKVVS